MLVDCLVMVVNGCMYAQQQVEIEDIKKNGYRGPPQGIIAALPPAQQKMIMQGQMGGGGGGGGYGGFAPQTVGAGAPRQEQMASQYQDSRPQPKPRQQPMPQQTMVQAIGQQQQQPIQVQCGVCQSVFGSPGYGLQVACPHCTTVNSVGPPPQQGYGGQQQYMQQQQYGQQGGQQGRGGNGTMMAAGAGVGVGVLGGMMMADMIM